MCINQVRVLASQFRRAVEEAQSEGCFKNDVAMNKFPYGCCGDASDLIGEYLLDNGFDDLWYVCGTYYVETGDAEFDYYERQSHAWITIGNPFENCVIVDITGDQFKDKIEYGCYNNPVFVDTPDRFHSLFEFEKRDVRPFRGSKSYEPGVWMVRLLHLYRVIVERITDHKN